eukprot:s2600_g1.t1
MMFAPTQSICSSYFFSLGAALVVPYAGDSCAQAWLWKFLVVSILVDAAQLASIPVFVSWLQCLGSTRPIGDGLIFVRMHTGRVRGATTRPFHRCWRAIFQGCAVDTYDRSCLLLGFTLGVFVFLGPNFIRQVPLTIMVLYGLWCTVGSERQRSEAQEALPLVYHYWVILAMLVLSSFFAVEMWSDLAHFTGAHGYQSMTQIGRSVRTVRPSFGVIELCTVFVSRAFDHLQPLLEEAAGHLVRHEERRIEQWMARKKQARSAAVGRIPAMWQFCSTHLPAAFFRLCTSSKSHLVLCAPF